MDEAAAGLSIRQLLKEDQVPGLAILGVLTAKETACRIVLECVGSVLQEDPCGNFQSSSQRRCATPLASFSKPIPTSKETGKVLRQCLRW